MQHWQAAAYIRKFFSYRVNTVQLVVAYTFIASGKNTVCTPTLMLKILGSN